LVLLFAFTGVTHAEYVGLYCLIVAAYSVGAYSSYRIASFAVLLATAAYVDARYGGVLPNLPNASGPFLILIPFWLIGIAMRNQQLRANIFEDKAVRLEREQEQATQLALSRERSRIARELHDVLAHSVSVMLVQAGAARQVLTTKPEEARQALLAVEASGREAMSELRSLLGLLDEETDDIDLAPQPGLGHIETLVSRVRDAGLPLELRVEGSPVRLRVGVDLAAYRIVQEALTNSLKYSGLARTQVVLMYRERELKIEVLDEGRQEMPAGDPSAGRGLVGMQERVAMYGGRLEAGPRLERGYAVRAWLPLDVRTEGEQAAIVVGMREGEPAATNAAESDSEAPETIAAASESERTDPMVELPEPPPRDTVLITPESLSADSVGVTSGSEPADSGISAREEQIVVPPASGESGVAYDGQATEVVRSTIAQNVKST
jgi:signal transduction histidine kinase